ncbi:50S ribosomal protein L3 [Candidatus Woesearchaeota archaeon]|nr:MAG: 50S ribosomal protein L3 [Candidatus Woesearchaeota archaeon]
MAKVGRPRHGSMQFWPRKRAAKETPKLRSFPKVDSALPVGLAGYKVGMTHLTFTDNRKNSKTKGDLVTWPVTIVEVPNLKVIGARFYKNHYGGMQPLTDVRADKLDKTFERKLTAPKKVNNKYPDSFDEARVLLGTQPSLTGFGKKRPEVFEMAIGGSNEEKIAYIKENLGKDLSPSDILKEGELLDSHSVTKGKGYQGPVKRFGIGLKASKSEKGRRRPGSLGGWKGHAHFMYRNPNAGKMGYHLRTEYNKLLLKIGDNPEEINAKGGFIRYGLVKNNYLLIKGSLGGPHKRLVILNKAIRPNKKLAIGEVPSIEHVSTSSKQGR